MSDLSFLLVVDGWACNTSICFSIAVDSTALMQAFPLRQMRIQVCRHNFLYKKRVPSVQIFSLGCKPSMIVSCSNNITLRSIVTINHQQIQNVWMAALPRSKIGRKNVLGQHVAGARNVPVSQWCFL